MSEKFIDNKHILHIAAEVVVMCGISFYFSSQIKTLRTVTEELSHKLEEQEDRLQKINKFSVSLNSGMVSYIEKNKEQMQLLMNKLEALEQSLNSVSNSIKQKGNEPEKKSLNPDSNLQKNRPAKSSMKTVDPIEKMLMNTMKMMQSPIVFEAPVQKSKIRFSPNIEEENEENVPQPNQIQNEDDELSESELDEEIQDELNDLKTKSVL